MADVNAERLAEIKLTELPESRTIRSSAFETWLAEIYEPQTRAEMLAVRDLAEARLALAEAEHRYQLRIEYEASVAPAAFDRALLDDYHRLERLWRKDVYAAHDQFVQNPHGVRAIARAWKALADETGPEAIGPTLEMALVAMRSEKQPWKIQELNDAGWAIVGRVLACCGYADEMVSDWLKRSGLKQKSELGERVRRRLKEFADVEQATKELHRMALQKTAEWAETVAKMQMQADEARRQQALMAMGVGEKGMTSAMRTARSILKFHNEEVRKRQKQLMDLLKNRAKDEKICRTHSQKHEAKQENAPVQMQLINQPRRPESSIAAKRQMSARSQPKFEGRQSSEKRRQITDKATSKIAEIPLHA